MLRSAVGRPGLLGWGLRIWWGGRWNGFHRKGIRTEVGPLPVGEWILGEAAIPEDGDLAECEVEAEEGDEDGDHGGPD